MKHILIVGLVCALVLAGGTTAFGQAQRGSITVTVQSPDGARLPGATITASSEQTLTRRTVISDGEGVADLIALDPANNYKIEVTLEGFATAQTENVLVKAGANTPLVVSMNLGGVEETLVVSAESPVVDVTNALTGQDLDLDLLTAVPLGGGAGSYQGALQLVPGVLPDDPTNPGNPASRSGVNYADVRGEMGRSSDNFYYIEGINVTDNETGRFGANLNSMVIQEQSVITGGVPAEFVGAPGLITNVVTKSGGNQFSGFGQLLLPGRQPGRRQRSLRGPDVLELRHRRHAGRPHPQGSACGSSRAGESPTVRTTWCRPKARRCARSKRTAIRGSEN